MTAERYPLQLMVLGVKGTPIEDKETEKDNPLIFNSLDRATEVAIEYSKEDDFPATIVMLSVLADGIKSKENGPMFDYIPQHIMAIQNALANIENNEDLHYRLEDADKLMKILAGLGVAIDKAKNN